MVTAKEICDRFNVPMIVLNDESINHQYEKFKEQCEKEFIISLGVSPKVLNQGR